MPRTKGSLNFKIKDLFKTTVNLKKRSKGKRPHWNKLLTETGFTVERLGRKTHTLERSMWEYAQLVHALRNCADVIEARAKAQEKESYEEASKLLDE